MIIYRQSCMKGGGFIFTRFFNFFNSSPNVPMHSGYGKGDLGGQKGFKNPLFGVLQRVLHIFVTCENL